MQLIIRGEFRRLCGANGSGVQWPYILFEYLVWIGCWAVRRFAFVLYFRSPIFTFFKRNTINIVYERVQYNISRRGDRSHAFGP
jgi:hypothetical protein